MKSIDRLNDYPNELTLVLGVDGAGKSTFMRNVQSFSEAAIIEPTRSMQSREFKARSLSRLVDGPFIDEREALFAGMNIELEKRLRKELKIRDVLTSGSGLTTKLSHAVMRSTIGMKGESVENIVNAWLESPEIVPDRVSFVHAPHEAIISRIQTRQNRGRRTEMFWGFNAPFFLAQYQASLAEAVNVIEQTTDIPVQSFDTTSAESVDLAVEHFFAAARQQS